MTSTPTRPVDDVITTKGLQDRNVKILDGTTVGNKGKLILTPVDVCFSCLVLCVVLCVRCLLRVLFVMYAIIYSSF